MNNFFNNIKFIKSIVNYKNYNSNNKLNIVLLGRSNVGKSSFINKICFRNKLAFFSKKPGKTKTVNLFSNNLIDIIDLPGFGYSKNSISENEKIKKIIIDFFIYKTNDSKIIFLLDSRRKISQLDYFFLTLIKKLKRDLIIVLTKIDKCKKNDIYKQKNYINNILNELKINNVEIILSNNQKNIEFNKLFSNIIIGSKK